MKKAMMWMLGTMLCFSLAGCILQPWGGWRVPNGEDASWRIVFEDEGLGRSERAAIAKDYLALLAGLAPRGSHGGWRDETGKEWRAMTWTAEHHSWPDAEGIGRLMVEEDGEEVAMVCKELSDAYRESFRLGKKYPEAYGQLAAAVERMNHWGEEAPPESFDEVFYFPEKDREYLLKFFGEIEKFQKGWQEWCEITDRFRSVLDRIEFEGLPGTILVISSEMKDGSGTFEMEYPFVFDGGCWKMVASDFGASC